jgi:hypothetical protein
MTEQEANIMLATLRAEYWALLSMLLETLAS